MWKSGYKNQTQVIHYTRDCFQRDSYRTAGGGGQGQQHKYSHFFRMQIDEALGTGARFKC